MKRCALSTSPRTQHERDRAMSDSRSTRPSGCSGRWWCAATASLTRRGRPRVPGDGRPAAAMRPQLPFELTGGQREVLEVISAELAATRPMNRMLQGEVGLGEDRRRPAGDAADDRRRLSVRHAGSDRGAGRTTRPLDPRDARSAGDGRSTRRLRRRDPCCAAYGFDVARSRSGRCATRSPPARRASSSAPTR